MVANRARGQLNGERIFFPVSLFAPENLVSRDGFGRPIPHQPAHSPYVRVSVLSLNLMLTHGLRSFLPLSATASVYANHRHGVRPVLIRSRICALAFTTESSPP